MRRIAFVAMLGTAGVASATPPKCEESSCLVDVLDAAGQLHLEKRRGGERPLRIVMLQPTTEGLASLQRIPWITSLELRGYVDDLTPIGKLTGLRDLDLAAVRAKTLAPLSSLRTLISLRIGMCEGTTDTDFGALANARELSRLSISACGAFTSAAPLGTLPRLRTLELVNTSIRSLDGLASSPVVELTVQGAAADVAALATLARLARLDLHGVQATELPRLSTTALVHASLVGSKALADLAGLRGQPRLVDVDLTGTAVSDLRPLADAPALAVIVVAGSHVRDLTPLAAAKALKVILIDDDAPAAMRAAFAKLRPDVSLRTTSEARKAAQGPR